MSRKQSAELDQLAREIVAAFRANRDADVSRLVDAGLRMSPKGLAYALTLQAAPLRFIAPDGQAFCAMRDGEIFAFWLYGHPDRWEACERRFAAGTLGSTLGYDLVHDDDPEWLDDLAARVIGDIEADG